MKVMITGASGFIGSHLTQRLLEQGHSVLGFYQNQRLRQQHPKLTAIQKNLSSNSIKADLEAHRPDCFVHAAALNPSVLLNQDQVNFQQFNHQVSMDLVGQFLDYAAVDSGANQRKLVNLSTYEIYGQSDLPGGHDLGASLQPLTDYARSKAKTHEAIEATQADTVKLINVVCSNNYGPWQRTEKLIPAVVQNLIHGKPIHLYGDGSSTRTWTYVQDTCDGVIKVLLEGEHNKYHLCSDEDASVEQIVRRLHHMLYQRKLINEQQPQFITHPTELNPTFKMNNQASVNDLKWQAAVNLDAGLSITLDHLLGAQKQ